jgi:hypothetical protein
MTLFYLIVLTLCWTIIPFIFLAVIVGLVREFEKEIKKRQELDDWRNEKLK